MKKRNNIPNTLILLVFLIVSNITIAQPPPPPPGGPEGPPPKEHRQKERRENIEAQKVGFLTKKLDLTPEEAQKFWPVYNQYDGKLQELRNKRREDMKNAKENVEGMSDKEIEQLVDNEMTFRQKELDLQKEYHSKFKAVLPIKKVAKLYRADEEFKRFLLNELKDRKPPGKE